MNYVSITDLNNYIVRHLHQFPHNVDLIVGIPRSGMLPANLLALYLNKPYTDIDAFVEGHVYGVGNRGRFIQHRDIKNILVVDDSIASGNALRQTKEKLSSIGRNYNISYAAIIATEDSKNLVDYFSEVVPFPRVFQWNIFHHPDFIPHACFDIDGVLCEDPPIDDDGPIYLDYIKNAIPKYIPTVEIHTIVTCRLEKYREATEEWLKKNKVKYKHLIMLNMSTREERLAWGKHGEFKGKVFADSDASYFVESSLQQAKEIVRISRKSVFCTETFTMLNYMDEATIYELLKLKANNFLIRIRDVIKRL